jgi:hypothetical protein
MKNIEEEIAKLIFKYAHNKRSADTAFINKLIELLIEYYKVEGYVNDAYLSDLQGEYLCAYDFYEKRIFIDYEKLFSEVMKSVEEEKKAGVLVTSDYIYHKICLFFLNSIAHELYHAKQYKRVDKRKNDLEKELLKLSFEGNLLIKQAEKEGRKLNPTEVQFVTSLGKAETIPGYYNALPSERMAQISTLKLGSIISKILNNKDLTDYSDLKVEKSKMVGYMEGECPSAYILSYHNKLKNFLGLTTDAEENYDLNMLHFEEIAQKLQVSDEDRFYHGLCVSEDLPKNQIDKYNKMVKKLVDKK